MVLHCLSCQEFLNSLANNSYIFCLYQRTPLHLAAKGGHYNIVKYLVEEGANVCITDELGVSVLDCTTEGRYPFRPFNPDHMVTRKIILYVVDSLLYILYTS